MLDNRNTQLKNDYLARRPAAQELVRIPTNIEVNADPGIADAQVISLWLCSKKNEHTKRAYKNDIRFFFEFVKKYLQEVTVQDLHTYHDELNRSSLKPKIRKYCQVRIMDSERVVIYRIITAIPA